MKKMKRTISAPEEYDHMDFTKLNHGPISVKSGISH